MLLQTVSQASAQGAGQPVNKISDLDAGRAAIANRGCVACHAIPGLPGPHGRVGPPLAGLATRVYIAGSLPNTLDNLVGWLRNPPSYRPDTAMPDLGLGETEAAQIAVYLRSLSERTRR